MPTSPRFNLITVMNLGTAGYAASDVTYTYSSPGLGPTNMYASLSMEIITVKKTVFV